jgi:hypothetical protein
MFRFKSFLAVAILALTFSLFSVAWADDVNINMDHNGGNDLAFTSTGSTSGLTFDHYDKDPFKGSATVTVTNSGSENWGGFHFEIFGSGIENVHFVDHIIMNDLAYAPSVSVDIDSYVINNTAVGATMDFFFDEAVSPTESVDFVIYTDNTENKVSFFGLGLWPTPVVPEPATLSIFAVGSLLIARRRK